MISVRGGWSVIRLTSWLETRWYHRMSRILLRHHWSSASIFLAPALDRAQHSDPYSIIGKIQMSYGAFNKINVLLLLVVVAAASLVAQSNESWTSWNFHNFCQLDRIGSDWTVYPLFTHTHTFITTVTLPHLAPSSCMTENKFSLKRNEESTVQLASCQCIEDSRQRQRDQHLTTETDLIQTNTTATKYLEPLTATTYT